MKTKTAINLASSREMSSGILKITLLTMAHVEMFSMGYESMT